ncbi:hypothetical protein EXS71_03205 [Candidatus Uhrbacteria bacterium]|nr:hypothetical protein [Candidatus Uhrbacteria bacterium]
MSPFESIRPGKKIRGIMAGLSLMAAGTEAQAKKMPDPTHIVYENRGQMIADYNYWIQGLKIAGLSIGEPKRLIRSPVMQIGVYINERHIGDLYSKLYLGRVPSFTKDELIEQVKSVVEDTDAIAIDDTTVTYLKKHGASVDGLTFIDAKGNSTDLLNEGQNERVVFEKRGDVVAVTTYGRNGSILEYSIKNGVIDLTSEKVIQKK